MASSTGNPNQPPPHQQQHQQQQQQGGPPFDMNKFFTTGGGGVPSSNMPSPQNPINNNQMGVGMTFPPSASYPPPTGGPYAAYPPQQPQLPTTANNSPYYYQHHHMGPPPSSSSYEQQPPHQLHPQRSASFPTPPLQPIPTAPPQNAAAGAGLMALLGANNNNNQPPPNIAPSIIHPQSSSEFTLLNPPPPPQPIHAIQAALSMNAPVRLPSSKLPRGRHLLGDHAVYDVDVRMTGEERPQLEVTPITKYTSDPGLVLGHQIAVNKTYICYGLKLGAIRVLNINTALRSLLRGHTQRVTDMAFFAEDVHLLASASVDGRVYVWKISEGPDEEDKPQISGDVVLAIHITGAEGSFHPRVCWHCHKQEILVVAIGKSILRIDSTKVGKGAVVAEEPLECPLDKLNDGIQLVGKHDGEVTDLSMCQWMTTRLVSASKDGTIKIWEDRKATPLLVLRPYDGQPVDAAKFLASPHRPDHIMLITAGPLNREVKLWASSGEEGWLLPSDVESWRCIQTLELKSSAEPRNEEAFFNQVVALSQAGIILLANAKKNAIYAIHLEYGGNPASTRMDYLAEFTVTMPILSFTGTSDVSPHGEPLVQVYCVQTQAIQQYALDLSQCLPPPLDSGGLEKSESTVSRNASESFPPLEPSGSKSFDLPFSAPKASNQLSIPQTSSDLKSTLVPGSNVSTSQEISTTNLDSRSASLLTASSLGDVVSVASPPIPLSPRLSRKLSDPRGDQGVSDYTVDRQMDCAQTSSSVMPPSDDERTVQGNGSDVIMFKHPTHLVTPAEIMAPQPSDGTRSAEKSDRGGIVQDVSNEMGSVEVEVKVVGEAGSTNNEESVRHTEPQIMTERKEKSFFSQASDLGVDVTRECCALPSEPSIMEEARNSIMEALAQPSNSGEEEEEEEEENEVNNDLSMTSVDFAGSTAAPQSPVPGPIGKKQKGKNSQAFGATDSPSRSVSSSPELLQGPTASSAVTYFEAILSELRDVKNQVMSVQKELPKEIQKEMQKELQKEMLKTMGSGVVVPLTKEIKRSEAATGRHVEKVGKANADASCARIQEDIAKIDKFMRERAQQYINNFVNKDLVVLLERVLKKETPALGTNFARALSPVIEKAVGDHLQKAGIAEKTVSQLDKSITSKVEATLARQIQAQFQTSVKQSLQEGLKSILEASLIPAFEMSCKAMFEQIDTAFQKGMAEHTSAAHQQVESTHSPLALALRDALNSASSLTHTLSGEFADGQRKLMALAAAGANTKVGNPLVSQLSNGPLAGLHDKIEQPFDPTKELSRLISEHKYEEAFTAALQRSDVFIVSWLCSQVDLQRLLSVVPVPLSQGVLLSLLQQLACDITKDMTRKLAWMTDVSTCISPHDPMIAVHVRPILEQVCQILNHQRSLQTATAAELSTIRVLIHLINSMLMTCK